MIPHNVAQEKCARNTSIPCGQISLTPLPSPKPAAHSGRNNSYATRALGRYGRVSERTKEMVSTIAPMVSTTRSGHHNRLCVNASLKFNGPNVREAKPASSPLINTRNAAINIAPNIWPKNRPEPAMVASRNPIQGVINGATRMPKINNACELTKYPAPRMTPAISENTKNSYDG